MLHRSAHAALALTLALAAACSASSTSKKAPDEGSNPGSKEENDGPRRLTLFVTTEIRGQIEPCGCSTDPLGDLARIVEMVEDSRASGTPTLVVDGGSLLYSAAPVPPHLEAQERLKADLLVRTFTEELEVAAVGLGPLDLGRGPGAVAPPRHAANLAPDAGVPRVPPEVVEVGGVEVGLFGVVSPAALAPHDLSATDPAEAARQALAGLRREGAEIVVGLAHMTRREAADLARAAPGIDVLVVGQNAPFDPDQVAQEPRRVGDTYLVRPANRGQIVTRLDLTIKDPPRPLSDAIGEHRAALAVAAAGEDIAELEAALAKWKADPDADPAFLQAKERELAALEERRDRLQASPLQAPDEGSYFVMTQVEINRGMACDQEVQAAKAAFNRAAGEANLAAAKGQEPTPPAEGQPGYVGVEECGMCHAEAVAFWQQTKHHEAWETLDELDKQFDYECIGCHVTGWERPGGATLAVNEPLRDVQCEVCHGPGSLHVEEDGVESPPTLVTAPPETVCVRCHNEEHSDTFQYDAYLRDVTGPGHGEAFRAKLGDGPTGAELRQAGLAKAGASLGAGCVK